MNSDGQIESNESELKRGAGTGRARSSIEFPYFDLVSSIEVAQAVKHVGGNTADWNQLAVKLSLAPNGGGFRSRVMAARTFGLLDYDRAVVTLSELGLRIVDPVYERAAKVEAFLTVPLYKSLFDRLNGQTLPPSSAVERMCEQLGVAPKQTDKARLAFMRSAKAAGLFELSSERLSLPPNLHTAGHSEAAESQRESGETRNDESNGQSGGRLRFEVPIPGKPSAVVQVPDDLDADDWEMLSQMMTTYIGRWKKFQKPE